MWDNNVPFIFLLLIPIPQFLARKSTVSLHIQALLSRKLVIFVVDAFGAQTEKPFFFPITNARSLQSTNQPTNNPLQQMMLPIPCCSKPVLGNHDDATRRLEACLTHPSRDYR